ncbi:uncharacterized protein Fot_00581 [Forsythia ovata]|uniref:Uncharacterized protein n=1 Tax=Forsythia ovata TaxID=205694 RepID=A0ABD1X234_9LAMI
MEESNRNVLGKDFVDFEFRLEDPVTMLPADELFFYGKLVSLQLFTIRHSMTAAPPLANVKLPDTTKFRRTNEISLTDPYLFSPKAPRCSSCWKEFLGFLSIPNMSRNANHNSRKHFRVRVMNT